MMETLLSLDFVYFRGAYSISGMLWVLARWTALPSLLFREIYSQRQSRYSIPSTRSLWTRG